MDGVILGVSGWFTPHGVRYHEEARTTDRIALDGWSALLVHADAIGFFTRPEPPAATSDARIFHVTISAGDRSRELTVHDPYEAPELALLIRLTRRAVRDRTVQRIAMLDEQQLAALQAVGSPAGDLIGSDRRCAGRLCGGSARLQVDDRAESERSVGSPWDYAHPMRRPRL